MESIIYDILTFADPLQPPFYLALHCSKYSGLQRVLVPLLVVSLCGAVAAGTANVLSFSPLPSLSSGVVQFVLCHRKSAARCNHNLRQYGQHCGGCMPQWLLVHNHLQPNVKPARQKIK